MLAEATAEFGRLAAVIETPEGRDPCPPGQAGSLLGDALALVAACAVAAVRWHGWAEADLEALAGRSASLPLSRPRLAADPPAPSRASPCPEPAGDAHHEHPAISTASRTASVSIPATPRASPHSSTPGMPFLDAHAQ